MTDPTHPLHGRRLRLVTITDVRDIGRACIVELARGVRRAVPIGATHLGLPKVAAPAHPLSPTVAQNLLELAASFPRQRGLDGRAAAGGSAAERHPGDAAANPRAPEPGREGPSQDRTRRRLAGGDRP